MSDRYLSVERMWLLFKACKKRGLRGKLIEIEEIRKKLILCRQK